VNGATDRRGNPTSGTTNIPSALIAAINCRWIPGEKRIGRRRRLISPPFRRARAGGPANDDGRLSINTTGAGDRIIIDRPLTTLADGVRRFPVTHCSPDGRSTENGREKRPAELDREGNRRRQVRPSGDKSDDGRKDEYVIFSLKRCFQKRVRLFCFLSATL